MEKREFGIKVQILIFIYCLLLGGVLSVSLGQATNDFDVYNYHIYSPWAFFNNRYTIDIMPAGVRSYFNPILDIPYFIMFKNLWNFPKLVGFIQGFWYGITVFLGYKISTLFVFKEKNHQIIFQALTLIFVATTPVIMFFCGLVSNDLHIAIIFLLGIYFLLKVLFLKNSTINSIELFNKYQKKNIIFASMLFGCCVGLKPTAIVLIFGVFIACVLMIKQINSPKKILIISILCFLLGFLLVNGLWYYKIWVHFKNPFFPYFNNIFHSPFGNEKPILASSYFYMKETIPENILQKIFYPIITFFDKDYVGFGSWIFYYRDPRIPVVSILIPIILAKNLFKKLYLKSDNQKILMFMCLFIIGTYILWFRLFPIVRYIIPVLVIGNIILVYAVLELISKIKHHLKKTLLIAIVSILILACSRVDLYEQRVDFEKTIFPEFNYKIEPNSTILLFGGLSYLSQQLSYDHNKKYISSRYVWLPVPQQVMKDKRTIDFYTSDYYENLVKNIINDSNELYFLIDKLYLDNNIYWESIDYYMSRKYHKECASFLYQLKEIDICKIVKD